MAEQPAAVMAAPDQQAAALLSVTDDAVSVFGVVKASIKAFNVVSSSHRESLIESGSRFQVEVRSGVTSVAAKGSGITATTRTDSASEKGTTTGTFSNRPVTEGSVHTAASEELSITITKERSTCSSIVAGSASTEPFVAHQGRFGEDLARLQDDEGNNTATANNKKAAKNSVLDVEGMYDAALPVVVITSKELINSATSTQQGSPASSSNALATSDAANLGRYRHFCEQQQNLATAALEGLTVELRILHLRGGATTVVYQQSVALEPLFEQGPMGMMATLHLEGVNLGSATLSGGSPAGPAGSPYRHSSGGSTLSGTLDLHLSFQDLHPLVDRLCHSYHIPNKSGGSKGSSTSNKEDAINGDENSTNKVEKGGTDLLMSPTMVLPDIQAGELRCCFIKRPPTGVEEDDAAAAYERQRRHPIQPYMNRRLEYGSLSLDTIYLACCCFFQHQRTSGKKVRFSKAVSAIFARHPHHRRWESLKDINLNSCILGDNGLLPVLATLQVCRCLKSFTADQSSLSLVSAKRLSTVFQDRRILQSLSLKHNNFYEAAGEEIIRLMRINRRILNCDIDGNAFSPYLTRRFDKQRLVNYHEFEDNVFNVTSSRYQYLQTEESLPAAAWELCMATWAMLTVQPMVMDDQDDEDKEHHAQSGGASMEGKKRVHDQLATNVELATGTSRLDPTVPMAITAPLFSLVLRTLERKMGELYDDPTVLKVFSDVASTVDSITEVTERGNVYPVSFAKMIAVPLRIMVGYPHRFRDAARVLQGLGRMHASLGVCDHHYSAASKIFIDALATHCGPEIVTPECRAAWCQVLALLVRFALSGTETIVGDEAA